MPLVYCTLFNFATQNKIPRQFKGEGFRRLFSLFVHCVLFLIFAELTHFQTILENLFIFSGIVVHCLTFSALKFDHVVL